MQALGMILTVLFILILPALCIGKIAARLGRSGLAFFLLAAIPLGSLLALGLLAVQSGKNGIRTTSHEPTERFQTELYSSRAADACGQMPQHAHEKSETAVNLVEADPWDRRQGK